jgi:putative MATE family efflux protein
MPSDKLLLIRKGQPMTLRQQLQLTLQLSLPAILAQISTIVMEYIDASMVGHLGANQSAAIGLVSSSIWLFAGLCSCVISGFSVQVAQLIGADNISKARSVLRQSITSVLIFCIIMVIIGSSISHALPGWLGGNDAISKDASSYFLIFILSLPAYGVVYLAGSMLRCSGNMKIPSILNVLMCALDIVFNALLIFPSRFYHVFGYKVFVPGGDLGVTGAALGSTIAVVITAILMMGYLLLRSPELKLSKEKGGFMPQEDCLKRAFRIGLPMSCEHFVMCAAQIVSTIIVAPLGIISIAANSFAITAESLCYMPGFGISDAATTLVGQCVGGGRQQLAQRFANITVILGMAVMTLMGIVMYIAAPLMMSIMTSNVEIQSLGVTVLRIEAFAEPMFAASIVSYGVFVGAGDTLIPSIMNLGSMWAVRLTIAAILAPILGLKGVWIAMCIELCFRGAIFLFRLIFRKSGYFSHQIATANS